MENLISKDDLFYEIEGRNILVTIKSDNISAVFVLESVAIIEDEILSRNSYLTINCEHVKITKINDGEFEIIDEDTKFCLADIQLV